MTATDRAQTMYGKTNFTVQKEKCTGCGKCIKVCPGGVLFMDEEKTVRMEAFSEFGWNGCWKCERSALPERYRFSDISRKIV